MKVVPQNYYSDYCSVISMTKYKVIKLQIEKEKETCICYCKIVYNFSVVFF